MEPARNVYNQQATIVEQIVSCRYGIPTTFWVENETSKRTRAQIEMIYASIDPLALYRGALWALSDHHRRLQYPFIRAGRTRDKFGRRVSFRCHACTLIACQQTGRKAFLMELDPLYCDVIVQRWEKFTGGKGERPGR